MEFVCAEKCEEIRKTTCINCRGLMVAVANTQSNKKVKSHNQSKSVEIHTHAYACKTALNWWQWKSIN